MTEKQMLETIRDLAEFYQEKTQDRFYEKLGKLVKKKLKKPNFS